MHKKTPQNFLRCFYLDSAFSAVKSHILFKYDSTKQVDLFFLTSKFMEAFNTGVFEFSFIHMSLSFNYLVK
jgi:hypothetical protein